MQVIKLNGCDIGYIYIAMTDSILKKHTLVTSATVLAVQLLVTHRPLLLHLLQKIYCILYADELTTQAPTSASTRSKSVSNM